MTDIIIITPDTNKKEIGCNFKNCSRISFCIMQRSRPQKFSFGSASLGLSLFGKQPGRRLCEFIQIADALRKKTYVFLHLVGG